MILVNNSGVATNVWIGKLSSGRETEVLATLKNLKTQTASIKN